MLDRNENSGSLQKRMLENANVRIDVLFIGLASKMIKNKTIFVSNYG